MRVFLSLAACTVAFAASVPLAGAELPGPAVPGGLGVNIHFTDPRPGEMEMLAAAGFRIVRMDFVWDRTEREKGRYDFSAYDRLMAAMEKHKLRGMWILDYTNRHYDDNQSPRSDEGRRAFAAWAAAAATHFRGKGVIWEMYNEPNVAPYWRPKPDVKLYAQLALEVGKGLRQAAPGEIYVGPAVSTMDFKFLEGCFQAGLLEYWDGVSVHPYRKTDPETVAADYATLRKLIARYAPRGRKVPIVSGEWGYSSSAKNLDHAWQGRMLARQFLFNLAESVPISIWYDWHDDGTSPKNWEHNLGTVFFPYHADRDPVYDPKPAYIAMKTLATALDGFSFGERLPMRPDDYVLVFRRGEEARWVAWTTAASEHSAKIPVPPGRYKILAYTGERLPDVAFQDGHLPLTLSDAPRYIVREK